MLLLLALADCYIIIIVFVVCVLIRRYLVNTVHELTRAWFRCGLGTIETNVQPLCDDNSVPVEADCHHDLLQPAQQLL